MRYSLHFHVSLSSVLLLFFLFAIFIIPIFRKRVSYAVVVVMVCIFPFLSSVC